LDSENKILIKNSNSILLQLKKISIEIIVIVFSVYVSIWLTNKNEHNKEQKDTKAFLTDLKIDLEQDIKNINEEIIITERTYTSLTTLLNITKEQAKYSPTIELKIALSIRKNNEANYEGFKSSGKISNIENRKLRKDIISYYQENLTVTTELEKESNKYKIEIIETLGGNNFKTNTLENSTFRTKLDLFKQLTYTLNENYKLDIAEAKKIIKQIDSYNK